MSAQTSDTRLTCDYIHVYTCTQALTYQHTPVSRVPSSKASGRTQRRRRDDIMKRRASISGSSGDAEAQLCVEIRTLHKEERQALLREAGIKSCLSATESLAIKAELALPWYRLRVLRT